MYRSRTAVADLFYATVFYKALALLRHEQWEPTLRYPRRWRRSVKLPTVCVQLPMFNETFVARRVIDYACRMDYPRERLYVQVLDDSTDPETRAVVDEVTRRATFARSHATVWPAPALSLLHNDPTTGHGLSQAVQTGTVHMGRCS